MMLENEPLVVLALTIVLQALEKYEATMLNFKTTNIIMTHGEHVFEKAHIRQPAAAGYPQAASPLRQTPPPA